MRAKCILLSLGLLLRLCLVYSQSDSDYFDATAFKLDIEAFSQSPDNRVLLANSSGDYPVTPGDVYKLTYLASEGSASFEAIVASDYSINLNLFGTVNGRNLAYPDLRSRIEAVILKAYPGSRPQLILQSVGIFQIYLRGEVRSSGFVNCWGLSRLTDVIVGRTTAYSSIRTIEIQRVKEKTAVYDLYAFLRGGAREQNPYLKPGDTVILSKAGRQVKLTGEIRRPGTYQLLSGDTLGEMIDSYGDGFTGQADLAGIRLIRYADAPGHPGQTIYLSAQAPDFAEFLLYDQDEIHVPAIREQLPFVYFEGAVAAANQSNIHAYAFIPGEKLGTAVRKLRELFTVNADLEHSYLIRQEAAEPVAVNLHKLLYGYAAEEDQLLLAEDRIVIPFRQFYVSVNGAVLNPGHYPYVPDKDYLYYINLAGGIDPAKNSRQSVIITDKAEQVYPVERIIQPEDRIFAEYNSFLYHLERLSPVIELTISITALLFGILQLLSNP